MKGTAVIVSEHLMESGEKSLFGVEGLLGFRNKSCRGNIIPLGTQAFVNLLAEVQILAFNPCWLTDHVQVFLLGTQFLNI